MSPGTIFKLDNNIFWEERETRRRLKDVKTFSNVLTSHGSQPVNVSVPFKPYKQFPLTLVKLTKKKSTTVQLSVSAFVKEMIHHLRINGYFKDTAAFGWTSCDCAL